MLIRLLRLGILAGFEKGVTQHAIGMAVIGVEGNGLGGILNSFLEGVA